MTLVETGTRAALGAAIGTYLTGELGLAGQIASGADAGDVVIFDRNFPSVALWDAYRATRAHLVMRAKKNHARDVVRELPDGSVLARVWHDRRRAPRSGKIARGARILRSHGVDTQRSSGSVLFCQNPAALDGSASYAGGHTRSRLTARERTGHAHPPQFQLNSRKVHTYTCASDLARFM